MPITLNGTTGITTPAITNNGTLTQTGAATLSSTLQSASTIGVGGATPAASGAGITFPATASASSDANTLDDYEEGSWTPTITASSGSITSYAANAGTYVKIGSLVMVSLEITLSNKGTIGSAIRIIGLPFTTSLNGFQGVGLAQANWSGLSGTLTGGFYGNAIYLYNQSSTNQTNLSGTNLTNTSEFGLSITYRVV